MSTNRIFTQEWFEFKKELRVDIMRSAWVPLYLNVSEYDGEYGYEGYQNETHCVRTLIVPMDMMGKVLELQFPEITCEHAPYVEDDLFHSADEYKARTSGIFGIHPVLMQNLSDESPEWHLHHDFILGLGLKKENDIWVCPNEDYEKVAELKRSAQGKPEGILIRMEHLRDFLCARNSGLLVATYSDRSIILSEKPNFSWKNDRAKNIDNDNHLKWEGNITTIAEGGLTYGSSTAVFWAGRKTPEPEDEVPTHRGPCNEDLDSSFSEIKHTGKKFYEVLSRFWQNKWIPPASRSHRVRGDLEESIIEFIVDASGGHASGSNLENLRGWLWFKPSIIRELLSKRHGTLKWCTEDTGRVGSSPTYSVHFGVNSKGLINVYAKDIYLLPDFHKRIWQAHNILPDGCPSQELWEAQMRGRPAKTNAPEADFFSALACLEKVSTERLGSPLLRHHDFVPSLYRYIHRFRDENMQGLCALAKDIDKLITERINTKLLECHAPPPDKNFRSIRRLIHFLDSIGSDGRQITAPLIGINTLRQGDAHLPSSELHEALTLIKIADTKNYLKMAKKMIEMICITLTTITDNIDKSSLTPKKSK